MPKVERAVRDDFPAVVALLESCELPTEGLEAHTDTLLVARHEGAIVGSAALEIYGGSALLRSVAVAASRRGLGLGGLLTDAALDLARETGVKNVYLLTETAEKFFPRHGFRRIDRDDVPAPVRRSIEFTKSCPEGATAMKATISGTF